MAMTWHATPFPGVRFREHESRMHGGEKDRYYSIRCKVRGKDIERGLGWASTGMTPEKALRELEALRASLRADSGAAAVLPARRRKPALSFSRFWEREYFPHITKTKAASSVTVEAGIYANWLEPAFGALALGRLTADRLESLVADVLEGGRSPRTARYLVSIVSQVWNLAMEKNFALPENPCARVSITAPDKTMVRLVRPDEIRKMLGVLDRRSRDLHDAVLLALFCGLGPGELFRVSWADISLARGTISIKGSKSRRGRIVFLPSAVNELLGKRNWESFSRMGGMQLTDYLFSRKPGIKREWFSRAFDRIAQEEGWNKKGAARQERVTLASFRHMYAIWLITGGVGLSTVADLMGHKTISLLQKYARFAPSPESLCRSVLDEEWKSLLGPSQT
ncbi:putative Integrase family protein [uncultured delta proteobacterium]|uniref:Putative Integrase family protein n=1 Tax=uncultured delta proteobacterium TaxID=34034 RepID=A0A212K4Q3_9DELT|nr:putative Integrase family protein [uncultured delta proteobacterium]